MLDILRHVVFVLGRGSVLTLITYATSLTDARGQSIIGYELAAFDGRVIFGGEDFAGSPLHADDSDATLRALLGFLTLRPGDTDAEHFADYTSAQWDFVHQHAEAMSDWALENGAAFVEVDG